MQGIRHLDWTERSGRCYRETQWRKPCACFAHALPFATDLSLSPSSPCFLSTTFSCFREVQRKSFNSPQDCQEEMPGGWEREAEWSCQSCGWVQGDSIPCLSWSWWRGAESGTQRGHPWLSVDTEPCSSALSWVSGGVHFPWWMQGMNRHSVSPTLGELQGESNDSVRDLKYNSS